MIGWLFSSSLKLILLKYSLFLRIIKLIVFFPFGYKYKDDWLTFFFFFQINTPEIFSFFANNASWKESNNLLSILLQIENGDWPTSFFFSSPKLIFPKYSFFRKWCTPKEIKRFSFVSLKCSKHELCHDSRRERFLFPLPTFSRDNRGQITCPGKSLIREYLVPSISLSKVCHATACIGDP